MRLLFTFAGGRGHYEPLVPLAADAALAGHTVAIAGTWRAAPTVEAAGFTFFPTGPRFEGPPRRPLRAVSAEREDRVLREHFADRLARARAADVLALCRTWRPDLVVCDEVDFGGMVAAERLGIPHATVLVIASGSFVRRELVAEPLDALRVEHGLDPDPDLAMPGRYLVLSPFPEVYRDPVIRPAATTHAIDAALVRPEVRGIAPPLVAHEGPPMVYVTLGTEFNLESGDLFSTILAGLRDLPVEVLMTVGGGIDPEELGPQPPQVHIERYVPQARVLPGCAAVVCHGGSGSVMGALAHGLPLVCIPLGADQPLNAARCAALGAGRVLDPVTATPASVREAVAAVLTEPGYRRAAERLRDEIAALPGPGRALALLEQLATERRPLRA